MPLSSNKSTKGAKQWSQSINTAVLRHGALTLLKFLESWMMRIIKSWLLASLTLAMCAFAGPLTAQERNVYWGDTHVHTSYSFDSYAWGNTAGPETAYRFAKGLPVIHPGLGSRVRLDRPLDFLVVADHSPVGAGAPIEGDRDSRDFQTAAWSLYVDAA